MAVSDKQIDSRKNKDRQKGARRTRAAKTNWRLWRYAKLAFIRISRFLGATIFSSLTRRIVVLNLAALLALVTGIFFLNQWRAGLIEARVQSLRIQGQIISAAIAASATVNSDVISVNPDRLLEFQPNNSVSPLSFYDPSLEFPISPERVAPLLRNLVTPTRTRARIYDKDGFLLLDSSSIYLSGEVIGKPKLEKPKPFFLTELAYRLLAWVPGDKFPLYQEYGASEGTRYSEVGAALNGEPADIVRVDKDGQLIVSVAVPVRRLRAIVGALLLSTKPGEIDAIVAAERLGVLRIALVAAIVTTLLSFILAGTIAEPMRRLSAAAERVQASMSARAEIPDYTARSDEIGHLSGALRSMTAALFNRIEAIESFAADVAHELKNPLTSLRSAVETLPLAKNQKDRDRLTAIIQHDVRRLDRLISDISNASRLDAELARDSNEIVDLFEIAQTMVSMHQDTAAKRNVSISIYSSGDHEPLVVGQDSRLAQVISNLIDNAVSFSPAGGQVSVSVIVENSNVMLKVSDQGQGIFGDPQHIFERFYTDRPASENFGDHSGLGLSISRQIVEAHKGTIKACNRDGQSGAVFCVILPRATA
ncbi:Sensor histidine kinase ChvG [hydrothermal vent metagenome]|uniref:histidine kinase n=1 Tax=hydrothermal vent metagenome TaxID=652676 RepID=A0A3B0U285_9ZZZZ